LLPTLLDELGARNKIRLRPSGAAFEQLTEPPPAQARALALIDPVVASVELRVGGP